MRRRRFTIARGMGWIAILAVNAGLIRAFVVQEMFYGRILMSFALQVGLWRLLRSGGRRRRFWQGFEVSGIAAVLALFSCEFFPDSTLNHLVMLYTAIVLGLAFHQLPMPMADFLDENMPLFLAVVYFLPELVVALAGGLIAAWVIPADRASARAGPAEAPGESVPS